MEEDERASEGRREDDERTFEPGGQLVTARRWYALFSMGKYLA